jgi:hypothetical protein
LLMVRCNRIFCKAREIKLCGDVSPHCNKKHVYRAVYPTGASHAEAPAMAGGQR